MFTPTNRSGKALPNRATLKSLTKGATINDYSKASPVNRKPVTPKVRKNISSSPSGK